MREEKEGKGQFIVAWTNPGNEDLLKAEIAWRFPAWAHSFSCKGLVSFKNSGNILDLTAISKIDLAFARRLGLFVRKFPCQEWGQYLEQEKSGVQCYLPLGKMDSPLTSLTSSLPLSTAGLSWCQGKIQQAVILGKEIWLVDCFIQEHQFGTPGATLPMECGYEVPSRAYYKMQHELKLHDNDWKKVIELGASPGGITYALLEQDICVHTVDNASLDNNSFFSQAMEQQKLVCHRQSVQEFLQSKTSIEQVDAVVSDMNIPCEQNLHLSLEVAKMYRAQELWLTMKIPVPKLILKFPEFEKRLRFWGAKKWQWCQLPAHRRETLLIVRK